MPVTVTVDHAQRRVFVRCTDVVTYADVERHLQIEEQNGGITYSGLIDFRGCGTNLSVDEVRSLANRIRTQWPLHNRGPAAIVADHLVVYGMARLFATLSDGAGDGVSLPIEVFRDIHDAEQWLSQFGAVRQPPATGE
jgi:hypothetical protein